MQHGAVGQAEVTGDVSALLLAVHNAKSANFLEGRDEVVVEVAAHFFIREGILTECLGVVSGEFGILKIA